VIYQILAKDIMFCEEVVIFTAQDVFALVNKKKIPFKPWFYGFLFYLENAILRLWKTIK